MGKVKGCSSLNSISSYLMLSNTVEIWDFTTYSISCVQCFLLKVSMGIFSGVFFFSTSKHHSKLLQGSCSLCCFRW